MVTVPMVQDGAGVRRIVIVSGVLLVNVSVVVHWASPKYVTWAVLRPVRKVTSAGNVTSS